MALERKTADKDRESVERMFEVGAHYGYSKSRRHPTVKPFIFGTKNRVEILDLEKTNDLLLIAKEFVSKLGREGKTLLFVGSKHEAREVVKETALSLNMPYVVRRWIGGSLTNFVEIKKRLVHLEELRANREEGELEKYTKKERLLIDREIARLEDRFLGLLSMKERLPDALFVIDSKHESIAMAEARVLGIPVVGLLNSDCNLEEVDYPILANDSTKKSISFFTKEIAAAYREGLANKLATTKEVSTEAKQS